ncbi:MAG: hypothetical protein JXR96_16515 [Deltaproteobacteria bacterium]|nr:hypothetical protein [Deltaproteobacteria bacterium]
MIAVCPAIGFVLVGLLWLGGIGVSISQAAWVRSRGMASHIALGLVALTALLAGLYWPGSAGTSLAGGGFHLDGFAIFVQFFVLLGALFCLLLGRHDREHWPPGSDGLLLLAAAGLVMLSMAVDLVGILAGLLAALMPLWGLAALRVRPHGRESALKSALLGGLGAVLLGMGAGLLAARCGTTTLEGLRACLEGGPWIGQDPTKVVALSLVIAGLCMFVAAVPLHMWFTDAVEGLPSPASLLLGGCWLAASLAATARVLLVGLKPVAQSGPGYLDWTSVLHVIGMLTLLAGNAMALVQPRLKRMLASLAAGQSGMVLITLAAAAGLQERADLERAVGGVLVFLAVHAISWVGLFVAVGVIELGDGDDPKVNRLDGLARCRPGLAAAIGLSLLCMAGMPLTAGFFPRIYLLQTMIEVGWISSAILVALSLGLVLVMCLGLVAAMVMRPGSPEGEIRTSPYLTIMAWMSALAILCLGIMPGWMLEIGQRSAGALF